MRNRTKNITPIEIEHILDCSFHGDLEGVLLGFHDYGLPYCERDASNFVDAVIYLARLYLYAHGDDRSQSVIDVSIRDFGREDTQTIIASSVVPALFHPYLKKTDSAILGGLSVGWSGDECTASACFPLSWYPTVNLANSKDVIKVACFFIFERLSVAINVVSPYEIDPQTLEWRNVSVKIPIQYAMDAIVNERVAACPKCGKPVYLANRKNAKRFCSITHQNRYNDAAKRMLKHGASVAEVYSAYPHIGSQETIEAWAKSINSGLKII